MEEYRAEYKTAVIKSVKVLCFDVFGTVVDWHGSVCREGQQISDKMGISVDWSEFVLRWRKEGYIANLLKIAAGEMDCIPTAEMHGEKLIELLDEYSITGLTDEQIEHFNLAWNRLDAWSDAVAGLELMKQDFMIMPFSNGDYRCLLDIAKRNALPWDGIISADFFNKVKPQLSIYLDAADLLCLDPSEIMMVACHAKDLDAAAEVGFRTAYINRLQEYGEGVTQEPKPNLYDYDENDFVQLANELKRDLHR